METDFAKLQQLLSYHFSQVKHMELALTHSSYANEHGLTGDNERLEFLGDAVLELSVSQMLYRRFPDQPEGMLTRLRAEMVSEPSLAALARDIGIDTLIRLGKGEEQQGGRKRNALLADALEAVFGAVFLDGGYQAAEEVVEGLFEDRIPDDPGAPRPKDPKSSLQELTQKIFRDRPTYTLTGSLGPEHAKVFETRLDLPDGRSVRARGPSVKKAEQKAAAKALALLEKKV